MPRRRTDSRASNVEHVDQAVVALSGRPAAWLPWKQFRALGCLSLMLCDVAAGGLDASLDAGPYHAPWDYLGGYLACVEAGAVVRDANGADLVTADPTARRQVIVAATPALADALMPARRRSGGPHGDAKMHEFWRAGDRNRMKGTS